MIIDEVAAKRYAKALFEVGLEKKNVEVLKNELSEFKILFEKEALGFLLNPVFSHEEKIKVVDKICEQRSFTEDTLYFLRLLIHENRIDSIPAIHRYYIEDLKEHSGIETAKVYSAVEMTKEQAEKLKKTLSKIRGKKIEVENLIDDAIIGGVKIEIGSFLYDGSVRTMLDKFKTV